MRRSAFTLLTLALLAAPLSSAHAGGRCQNVFTLGSFQILPPELCPESPVGLCAEATLYGSPLRGTYRYVVEELSLGAGLSSLPASTLSVTGEFVLETGAGTVLGTKTAMFDLVSGEGVTIYNLTSGPYSGTMFHSGFFDPETAFGSRHRNVLWGTICRAE